MRNPIRLKNLNLRFLPLYAVGLLVLAFYPPQTTGFLVALPLIGAGLWIRGWGAGHLVKNHDFTVTGPYAHLRHPLYAGTLLIATGFALLIGGWLSLAVVAMLWLWFALHYFPRKERSEGARLEALYGEAFVRYRDSVPALWPRFSSWREAESLRPEAEREASRGWTLDRYSENNELGTLLAVLAGVLVLGLRAGLVGR